MLELSRFTSPQSTAGSASCLRPASTISLDNTVRAFRNPDSLIFDDHGLDEPHHPRSLERYELVIASDRDGED